MPKVTEGDSPIVVLDDLPQLRRKVERLKERSDRAKGALDHMLSRLKTEFGCESIAEAKAKLVELEDEERRAAAVYVKRKKAFLTKWKDVLEEKDDGP